MKGKYKICSKPTTCVVCKTCRLRQRDRQDAKDASAETPHNREQTSLNLFRMTQYQAGASTTAAQIRPHKGNGDHWCGAEPCSEDHKTYGPYFCALLRERLIKRASRGKSLLAFNRISRALANLPVLAKRITGGVWLRLHVWGII